MVIQSWADVLVGSFQNIWGGFVEFLPRLVGALIIFVVGLIIANGLKVLVEQVVKSIKLDSVLEKAGLKKFFERADWEIKSGAFLGALVQWFLIIVFLLAAVDILKLYGLAGFLQAILLYIPNIIIAVLIVLVAVVVGGFLRKVVQGAVKSAKLQSGKMLGTITWWAVMVFGFFAALLQLGVAVMIVNTIITGFIAMLAIAGGIAFGLGGQKNAAELVDRLQDKLEEKRGK